MRADRQARKADRAARLADKAAQAVRDGLAILLPVLEHACETIAGPHDHG